MPKINNSLITQARFAYLRCKTDNKWLLLLNNILEKTCKDAIEHRSDYGPVMEKSMLSNMSNFNLMQDGAPAHTANLTQVWCAEHLTGFLAQRGWPGYSPDLNPIENLWFILKDSVSQMMNVTKSKTWASIHPNTWKICQSNRIKLEIDSTGIYIKKIKTQT